VIDDALKADPKIKPYLAKAYEKKRDEIKKMLNIPKPSTALSEYVVVANLPAITKDKEEAFFKVFFTFVTKLNLPIERKDITLPFNEEGTESLGWILIKCSDVKTADTVAKKLYNLKFGKNTMKSVIMSDFDSVINSPPIEEFSFSMVDLHEWILEPIAQQYCMAIGKKLNLWWHTDPSRSSEDPIEIKLKEEIKCNDFTWSPKGTYLVTRDENGLTLYGGPEMTKLKEFKHKQISGCKISNNEEYLYLYDSKDKSERINNLHVYSIKTEKELRDFTSLKEETKSSFGWSYDGKYLAKMSKDLLSIYETPDMHMISDESKKRSSLKVENIRSFAWASTSNVVAIFKRPEKAGEGASMIELIEIPTRERIYFKTIQLVESCQLIWHPNGKLLALIMTLKTPGGELIKNGMIGLLNIDKKGIEYVDVELSEVSVFEWEPTNDHHFAILRLQKDKLMNKKETVIEVFQVSTMPLRMSLIKGSSYVYSLTNINWSPLGSFMVASRLVDPKHHLLGAIYGTQYFFYVKDNHVYSVNTDSHDSARGASWDPSGRFYSTFSTSEIRADNDSFNIYNCFGEIMHKEKVQGLLNWKWRQRSLTELSASDIERIRKNLPEYTKRFKQLDKQARDTMRAHLTARKKAKLDKFLKTYLEPKLEKYKSQRPEREKILGHPEFVEDDYEVKEYYEEALVEEKLEPIS